MREVVADFISALVDRIVFSDNLSKEKRSEIAAAGIEAIYTMLYQ